jgi:hypothetical protein
MEYITLQATFENFNAVSKYVEFEKCNDVLIETCATGHAYLRTDSNRVLFRVRSAAENIT